MSNANHTPGPWTFSRWDQFGDARFYVSQQDGAPYTPNYSDVATLIAETVSGDLVRVQEANARLIAAAPELLDLLIKARRYVGMVTEIAGDDPIFGVMDEIDAVIAKARGEA
ncbi:hypothetical protein [Burkholderia ambifaria]|uniref:hypothetical protein n=1 Tax=Burkholderia ambifaria TaxID=152480 RepID=UPI00158C614F|nr:hypothetical protein [Burkholderia ambifaria]